MNNEFSLPVRVYIEDTDAGGIVYYVNYLKFMERSRTELLRECGFHKPAILEEGMLLVVASVNVDYKKSAKLDDELSVTARINKLARSYFVVDQSIYRGDECLTNGQVKVACVNKNTLRPCAFPERVARLLNLAL
ncbi:MAG: tol-pal system-associated acyl-CoA thioesterase [Agarilytica sp.]